MAWPEAPAYTTALEHPEMCFDDSELLQGKPAVDEQGLPHTIAGAFSAVYKINRDGQPPLAAKCYTRTLPNLAARYQALTTHLKPLNLPFLVDCQLLEQGIKVQEAWFPVLKMPWIEGKTLNVAVRDNLDKPRLFATLAELWFRIAVQLRKAQIAHGDLQHANILLVSGTRAGAIGLRLVDYDGMYVPALADQPAHEVGHRAYQHPQRSNGGYGPEMDRFSHLVLYTALRLLHLGGKTLWSRHDNGENLLFRAEDFIKPSTSRLLRDTQLLKDGDLKTLAAHVFLASQGPLEKVPLLEELIVNGKTTPLSTAQEALLKKWLTPTVTPKVGAAAALPPVAPLAVKPAAPPATNGEPAAPIKVRCDGCKKTLSVKAHLAGKRVPCPVCKKPLTIPAPVAAAAEVEPPENLEDLAAAALFDDPLAKQQEAEEAAKTIDFECAFCDEPLHFPLELAGKQEPCPHCKRIVKVPVPKNAKPKDWREVMTGPTVAQMSQPRPEDIMSSAQKSAVHVGSLEEAGVLPEKYAPVPIRTRVRQVLKWAVVLTIIVVGWWKISSYRGQSEQQQALDKALAANLKPLPTAALQRTAAEFYLRAQQADKAQDYLNKAVRAPFAEDKDSEAVTVERDAFLIDLVLLWIDLGGSDAEDIDKVKVKWEIVESDLGKLLLKISSWEARQTALREVTAKLLKLDKMDLAQALAGLLSNAGEEEHPEGENDPLAALNRKNIVSAQQLALLLKEEKLAEAKALAELPKANAEPHPIARQGYAEGAAWKGDFVEAMRVVKLAEANKKTSLERLQAALGVAAVALLTEKTNEAQAPLEYAQKCLAELEKISAKDQPSLPAWDWLQLTRMLAKAGKAEDAKTLIDKMTDKSAKSRAQLEVLRLRVASTKNPLPMTAVDDITDKDALAYAQALEALARHNTRLGQQTLVTEALAGEGLEERFKPFLYSGMALGLQDR